MIPNICHIYGPLYINCYGLAIVIGLITFFLLIQKNQRFKNLITIEQFKNCLLLCILVAAIGARILWIIEDYKSIENIYDILAPWQPGYASLGSLIGILIFLPIYLRKIKVSILPFLDLIAIYVPLLHSIARIGCFLAGCCHGIQTNSIFGIIYTHPQAFLPDSFKFIKIHPTQLYSSLSLFLIFLFMYYIAQHRFKKVGELTAIYLILASFERFFNDFLRYNREFIDLPILNTFSIDQLIAIAIFSLGLIIFFVVNKEKHLRPFDSAHGSVD